MLISIVLFAIQLVGPRTELPRRVESLLSSSRMQASTGGFSYMFLPGNNKIDDQSLAEMHKVCPPSSNSPSFGKDRSRLLTVLVSMGDVRAIDSLSTYNIGIGLE
jgi:hypothetical protein